MADSNSNNSVSSKYHVCGSYNKLIIAFVSLVVLAVVFCSGIAIGRFVGHNRMFNINHGDMFGRRFNSQSTSQSVANEIQISGVVTAVNGNSFNVAGNGVTNTVYTNSQTVYLNSTKPSVNDAVRVLGSISNSKFTAQSISVNQY